MRKTSMLNIFRPVFMLLTFGVSLAFAPIGAAQVSSNEWEQRFNPYTGRWESLNPPAPAPPVVRRAVPEPASLPEAPKPEIDYTSKEAALLILQHEEDDTAKWTFEQPVCPRMHYHKPLTGKDVCANPLGADVKVACPAGTSLIVDHHPAGSDACRGRRS